MPATRRNRAYLITKRDKMGHLLTLAPPPAAAQTRRTASRAKGEAMNFYEGSLVATGLKIGLVVARFNSLVTEQLLLGAADTLRRHGVKDADIDVFRCPGTFESLRCSGASPGAAAMTRSSRSAR